MGEKTEIQHWEGLRNGLEKEMYALYTHFYNDLLRYGLKMTDDIEATKDNINQLFLHLWQNREKLPQVESPKAYILTCFKNKILLDRKRSGRLPTFSLEVTGSDFGASSSYEETYIEIQEHQKLKQRLDKMLNTLTERQRQLIKLRFIEELSYEEIAEKMNISVRTVYNSIHESLKTLRKELDGKSISGFFSLLSLI